MHGLLLRGASSSSGLLNLQQSVKAELWRDFDYDRLLSIDQQPAYDNSHNSLLQFYQEYTHVQKEEADCFADYNNF